MTCMAQINQNRIAIAPNHQLQELINNAADYRLYGSCFRRKDKPSTMLKVEVQRIIIVVKQVIQSSRQLYYSIATSIYQKPSALQPRMALQVVSACSGMSCNQTNHFMLAGQVSFVLEPH
jgi:hypothetical protein